MSSLIDHPAPTSSLPLPRITIRFCTQCKWMLRAAYFAQELLSTFSTALGEVALQPSTGGTFIVDIFYTPPSSKSNVNPGTQHQTLWDRKSDGGFPETKELKRRVRDVIEPGRNLGHVDRDSSKAEQAKTSAESSQAHSDTMMTMTDLTNNDPNQDQSQSSPTGPKGDRRRADQSMPRMPLGPPGPSVDSRSWKTSGPHADFEDEPNQAKEQPGTEKKEECEDCK